MSPKFSNVPTRPLPTTRTAPVTTTDVRTVTHEGGGAYERDAESSLFLLAATNMVGEDSFYESAEVRDGRFAALVAQVTKSNPAFIAGLGERRGLVDYLRNDLLMRSASVVMACEYVKAGGPRGRMAIDAACQRPDEPAEVLGYWMSHYGRNVPQPVKRGCADAVRRLYNERAALRYDGQSRGLRMGDVVEVVHPKPRDAKQAALFKYLLDQRHHGDGAERAREFVSLPSDTGWEAFTSPLPVIDQSAWLAAIPEGDRRGQLRRNPHVLASAGWSWERLAGWLPGGMDAEAWGFIAPTMGVMALVRNLRNFDEAGVSDEVVDQVIARITDEDQVRRGRLFPFHAWQAYSHAPSDNWKRALGKTLDLTTRNIPPALDGSLVLVDVSGSMMDTLSFKSTLTRWEVGAVLGASLAHGTKDSDVVAFGTLNEKVRYPVGSSALSIVESVSNILHNGRLGYGTNGHTALRDHWDPKRHKRAFIVTDDQMHDSMDAPFYRQHYGARGGVDVSHVPLIHTVNLAGHAPSSLPSGSNGRYTMGGFGDAGFRMVAAIEAGRNASWEF